MLSTRLARTAAATGGLLAVLAGFAVTSPTAGAGSPPATVAHRGPNDAARGLVWDGLEPGRAGTRCAGAFEIRGRADEVLGCTHGPDPAPAGVDVRDGRSEARLVADAAGADSLDATGIACIGDGTSGYRVQAIYAVPADRTDRSSLVVPAIRETYAPEVESQFNRSAAETGGEAHVPFVTNPSATSTCELDVDVVTLSGTADDAFNNTITELRTLGYTRADRKYLVWMESNVLCGIGSIYGDTRPTQDNWNNGYAAMFARADSGCWSYAEAHELMHNLGGVQPGAPNATAGYHCVDEPDEMCYDDDGSGPVVMRSVCSGRDGTLFDCRHDDYFLAGTPASGTWLATHWNTYDSRFLHRGPLGSPPPPSNEAPVADAGPDKTATVGQAVTLTGSLTDDGQPAGSTVTATWSQVSGPSTMSFTSPSSPTTAATASIAGTYVLRLTGSDGELTATDDVTVTANPAPTTVTKSFSGTLTAKSRSKTHNFTSSPGTISAQVTSTAGRTVTVSLYDGAKRRIATQTSATGSLSLTGASTRSGTHRLVVEGQSLTYTATITHPA